MTTQRPPVRKERTMDKEFTATVGERTVAITIKEWPQIAADALRNGQKAYLVSNKTLQVVAEA